MVSALHALSFVAGTAAFLFVLLSLGEQLPDTRFESRLLRLTTPPPAASGLLYVAEVIEEHAGLAKVIGQRTIYVRRALITGSFYASSSRAARVAPPPRPSRSSRQGPAHELNRKEWTRRCLLCGCTRQAACDITRRRKLCEGRSSTRLLLLVYNCSKDTQELTDHQPSHFRPSC